MSVLIIVLSVATFLMGLVLIGVAYLSAHRTVVPSFKHPGVLWWPALGLMAVAVLILAGPSFVSHAQCERTCDAFEGQAREEDYAQIVQTEFESCIRAGINEVKRKGFERRKEGADVDIDAEAKKAEPGLREVCHTMVFNRCVTACYRPDEGV